MLRKVRVTVEFVARDGSTIFKVREVSAENYIKMNHGVQGDYIGFMARTAHSELRNVIYRGGLSDAYYSLPEGGPGDGLHEPGEAGEGDGEGS